MDKDKKIKVYKKSFDQIRKQYPEMTMGEYTQRLKEETKIHAELEKKYIQEKEMNILNIRNNYYNSLLGKFFKISYINRKGSDEKDIQNILIFKLCGSFPSLNVLEQRGLFTSVKIDKVYSVSITLEKNINLSYVVDYENNKITVQCLLNNFIEFINFINYDIETKKIKTEYNKLKHKVNNNYIKYFNLNKYFAQKIEIISEEEYNRLVNKCEKILTTFNSSDF